MSLLNSTPHHHTNLWWRRGLAATLLTCVPFWADPYPPFCPPPPSLVGRDQKKTVVHPLSSTLEEGGGELQSRVLNVLNKETKINNQVFSRKKVPKFMKLFMLSNNFVTDCVCVFLRPPKNMFWILFSNFFFTLLMKCFKCDNEFLTCWAH